MKQNIAVRLCGWGENICLEFRKHLEKLRVEKDDQPRTVAVPDDFADALAKVKLRDAFDAMGYTHRKEHVRAIEEAKAPETRLRRIGKAVDFVGAMKKG